MSNMPKRVNVMHTIGYNVDEIVESLKDLGWSDDEITESLVYDYIRDCIEDDFREPPSRHDLIWQDENGNEL